MEVGNTRGEQDTHWWGWVGAAVSVRELSSQPPFQGVPVFFQGGQLRQIFIVVCKNKVGNTQIGELLSKEGY